MRKTVYVCTCDVCKKVIEDESKRFIIKLGVGDWVRHDSFEEKLDEDLCSDCYTEFFDMAERTKTSDEEREFTAAVIKKSVKERNEEIWNLYEKGMGTREISNKFNMNLSTVSCIITRHKKANGIPLSR